MHFAPAILEDCDTGRLHDIFLPQPVKAGWHEDDVSDITEVTIDKSTIAVPTHLLRKVLEFGLSAEERAIRTNLGHDCIVFALACETGSSLANVQFGAEANRLVHVGNFSVNVTPECGYMSEPDLEEGEIVFTANALPNNPAFLVPEVAKMHFMVRAGADEQGSVYFSKFGQLGPVAAHRIDTSLEYYPAQTIGQASGLSIMPAI